MNLDEINMIEGLVNAAEFMLSPEFQEHVNMAINSTNKSEIKERNKLFNQMKQKIKENSNHEAYKKIEKDLMKIIKASIVSLSPLELELYQLEFKCLQCGNCCKKTHNITVTFDEYEEIIRKIGKEEKSNFIELTQQKFAEIQGRKNYRDDTNAIHAYTESFVFKQDEPCKYHDSKSNNCKIYNLRPKVCRNFPFNINSQGAISFVTWCDGMFEVYYNKILAMIIGYSIKNNLIPPKKETE